MAAIALEPTRPSAAASTSNHPSRALTLLGLRELVRCLALAGEGNP